MDEDDRVGEGSKGVKVIYLGLLMGH
jgi:hypothetical protein